jgi:polyhydroxybutyrate depolymerase
MLRLALTLVIMFCGASAQPAYACGASSACAVDGGEYRFLVPHVLPSGQSSLASVNVPTPGLLIFIHGHRSSAAEMLAYSELVEAARALNLVLVAPQGRGDTWSTPGAPGSGSSGQNRDEVSFIRRVLDDLGRRVTYDPRRVVLSGFSQGASVVWHVACAGEPRVGLYMPIAGVWWQPMPHTCAGPPVKLLHIHGMADGVMPMAGRRLRDTWQQGDVKEAIRRMSAHNQCNGVSVTEVSVPLTCTLASSCAKGASLSLCLHEGDHHTDPRWFVLLRNQIGRALQSDESLQSDGSLR